MGSTPIEPDVNPLGVDIAKTVDEWERNWFIMVSLTKTLTDMGAGVVKTIKESKITESIGNGVQTVKEKLTDPNLQNEIRDGVQNGKGKIVCWRIGWNWLSGTAISLWNTARDTASSFAAEFMEEEHIPNDQPAGGTIPPSKSSNDLQ